MAHKPFESGTRQSFYVLPVVTIFLMDFETALEDCPEH